MSSQDQDFEVNQAALVYHSEPKPGKISVEVSKPTETARDLSLAYTPGVAEPVRKIAANAEDAYKYTAKGNLVAVITDGTAVLGLGNVGSLAGKPVMEGKGVLFKHFAGIDCFDIEVDAESHQDFIDTCRRIAPTFGGINLEDIAAPHCFDIEEALVEQLDIPVFHDDQHGTAIIIAAGLMNALELQGKQLSDATMVILGAGAAGIASVRLLHAMGANPDKIMMIDRQGVIYQGRDNLNKHKESVAANTDKRTLEEAMNGADVFIGLSGPDLISPEMLASMAAKPVVMALSNPVPEIRPEVAMKVRDDMIMATGRTDYPNQVNNVLGFPFIFRGALDVRASKITREMHIAAVNALKDLAREPVPQSVLDAYGADAMSFGPEYILPKPLDPRLGDVLPPAIARAAIESGVARGEWPAHYPAK
jgi:malate dehydrogenase (oxaloacetate-decarboxylating)(NADP+)